MENAYALFRDKLAEIFQMDRAELDFGMYRIMNVKRGAIDRYLDEDLLPQVEEVLSGREDESIRNRQEELAKLETTLADTGMDPATSPKVRELRTEDADSTSLHPPRRLFIKKALCMNSRPSLTLR